MGFGLLARWGGIYSFGSSLMFFGDFTVWATFAAAFREDTRDVQIGEIKPLDIGSFTFVRFLS